MEYVKIKLTPALRGIDGWADELQFWEEAEYEGLNLVECFARWTEYLYQDNPYLMQQLHNEAARDNSVAVAYYPPENSTFYFTYAKQRHDLTFAVLVIRGMMLRARPAVADSVGGAVNMALLDCMEELLGRFPMSAADAQHSLDRARLASMKSLLQRPPLY